MSKYFMAIRPAITAAFLANLGGCATYQTAKEITLVGFTEDVTKGKSVGQVNADDCVFYILRYPLGGAPTLSKALDNAKRQRTSSIGDTFGSDKGGGEANQLRYINHANVSNSGFDAYLFGKSCINISGMGYK